MKTILIFFLLVIAIVGCSPPKVETCDIDGSIYKTLLENQEEWVSFFTNPTNHNETVKVRINNFNYAIRQHNTSSDEVTIYIPTNTGIPASMLGESGYFYTNDSVLDFNDDRFRVTKLTDRTYCYERIK